MPADTVHSASRWAAPVLARVKKSHAFLNTNSFWPAVDHGVLRPPNPSRNAEARAHVCYQLCATRALSCSGTRCWERSALAPEVDRDFSFFFCYLLNGLSLVITGGPWSAILALTKTIGESFSAKHWLAAQFRKSVSVKFQFRSDRLCGDFDDDGNVYWERFGEKRWVESKSTSSRGPPIFTTKQLLQILAEETKHRAVWRGKSLFVKLISFYRS